MFSNWTAGSKLDWPIGSMISSIDRDDGLFQKIVRILLWNTILNASDDWLDQHIKLHGILFTTTKGHRPKRNAPEHELPADEAKLVFILSICKHIWPIEYVNETHHKSFSLCVFKRYSYHFNALIWMLEKHNCRTIMGMWPSYHII